MFSIAAFSIAGFQFTGPVILLGVINGVTYGILAVGLIIVYRTSRVINFAQGAIGAVGAALAGVMIVKWGLPYWFAFVVGILTAGVVAGLSEMVIIRRLRQAPIAVSIVATLGLSQFLLYASSAINTVPLGTAYPQPSGLPSFKAGPLLVTPAYFGMLVVGPALVAVLAIFFKRTRLGLGIRASAANPDSARLSGVFSGRMSMLAWAISGLVAGYAAIFMEPTLGVVNSETLGPGLLLRALACAVIARMSNLVVALGAGLGIGIIEQELLWNYPSSNLVDVVLFVIILLTLLVRKPQTGRLDDKAAWIAVQPWRPLPAAARRSFAVRNLGYAAALGGLGVAALLWLITSNSTATILTTIVAFSVVGLSIGVITGLSGQVSLGQFGIAAVGAAVGYRIMTATGDPFTGFVGAAAAGAAISLLIGLPAARIRGLMFAVATLAFALATSDWLLNQPWMLSANGVSPIPVKIFGFTIQTAKSYFAFSVVVLAIGLWLARNVWRGGIGRRLRAVRDNEDGARAFTVPATAVKLQGFAVGGILAGLGGALYASSLPQINASVFPIDLSITAVAVAALGGLGLLAGPILGALYIVGVPQWLPLDSAELAATSLGWLIVVVVNPGGFAQVIAPIRDKIVAALLRREGMEETDGLTGEDAAVATDSISETAELVPTIVRRERAVGEQGGVLLDVTGISKSFGGTRAVNGVSLQVLEGETLGLIGPNGAGKTTLFELLGGFTRPDDGQVVFSGRDVTRLSPEARGRLGLIRSFQDAALFPSFTVLEVLTLAQERRNPTSFVPSAIGWQRAEKRKTSRAREIASLMGLESFLDKQIIELSTGTRRIAELACVVALEPRLLLLDEPSSGVAQRETEALGELLPRLKERLGVTFVIIEHDIPLIMGMSDRIVAMESGRVIAVGSPEAIRNDPKVIESYLGEGASTVTRSDETAFTPVMSMEGES